MLWNIEQLVMVFTFLFTFLFGKCTCIWSFVFVLFPPHPLLPKGHNLTSQWLDTLQHRLHSCKVPSWSRIGRLKRQVMPKVWQLNHVVVSVYMYVRMILLQYSVLCFYFVAWYIVFLEILVNLYVTLVVLK